MSMQPLSDLSFFLGPPHACGYFTDRQARCVYADPRLPVETIVGEPLTIHRLGNRAERRDRTVALLESVRQFLHLLAGNPDAYEPHTPEDDAL